MTKKITFTLILIILAGPAAYARTGGITITRADWSGTSQGLEIWAKEASGRQTITALYNDQSYEMKYDKRNRRYALTLSPVCYDASVALTSTSGSTITGAVKDVDGTASSWPCGNECPDLDGDGFTDSACGGTDCDDSNAAIHPGLTEICGDGIDQNCSGQADETCSADPHAGLSYGQYPANCLSCHQDKAREVSQSTHYQWLGDAPDMVNGTGVKQGKLTNAVNSYCINILGNWKGCGACHAGRGKRPDDPTADLANIDCLVCHSTEYALQRKRLADGSMGVDIPTDSMVKNVALPERTNCLVCHAKAGGGDGVKRGDLSMALITNTDPAFDVHMNSGTGDLTCQSCHTFENHRVIGKGSDLRATDDLQRGSRIDCAKCHTGQDTLTGHDNPDIGEHVQRLACQTCHIPTYAKFPTETHRDWQFHANGTPADGVSGPGHPLTTKASSLMPEYKFWNGKSDNTLLGDDASRTFDPDFGTFPTSRPMGDINNSDSKLYPFKYKTGRQPKTTRDDRLIALDTGEYLTTTGNVATAIAKGLVNMGYPATEPYEWILTDTYQLINHGVEPASGTDTAGGPLSCTDCHNTTERMDLQGELGYVVKASTDTVCTQCHDRKEVKPFEVLHQKHVQDKRYDCSWCHNFSRPEKGLRMP